MALLATLLALLLGTGITFALIPYLFHLTGRLLGNSIRSSTQQRRELLLNRAKAEEKEEEEALRQQEESNDPRPQTTTTTDSKQTSTTTSSSSSSSSASSDSDWEKVTPRHPTPNTPSLTPDPTFTGIISFFHPFSNAGGGGERVLFAALLATQHLYPRALSIIYTGDHSASKTQILHNARIRFNILLRPSRIAFLYLSTRDWVSASRWPRFTLLGQSVGSLMMGWEAFNLLVPDLVVDTAGYAFAVAGVGKWLFPALPVGGYVHYPVISTDMLASLREEVASGRGLNAGAGKGVRGRVKQVYWELFAKLYCWVGGHMDVVMTNSSWTQDHISRLWGPAREKRGKRHPISVVYPPCAVEELTAAIPLTPETSKSRTRNVLYIAQFRPEKMHTLILDAFSLFLKKHPHLTEADPPRLVLVGSVRDDQDEKRVYKLRLQAQEMKEHVDFVVNAQWPQILEYLKTSSVGVNGMWNEHFGIGVVEYQAAGLISVVNDSGGPKRDIVVDIDGKPTGFHASTAEHFAEGFAKALSLSEDETFAMRERARKSSWRFSEKVFEDAWIGQLRRLVAMLPASHKKKG